METPLAAKPDTKHPVLQTTRLHLRPVAFADAPMLHELGNDPQITKNLADMAYPHPLEAVQQMIGAMQDLMPQGKVYAFVITSQHSQPQTPLGIIYLVPDATNQRGELIYWLGRRFWGCGYMTEAVHAVIQFAFDVLNLHRVYADVFPTNPASARVLEKCGLQYEGTLRQHLMKDGKFIDLRCYGLLRDEHQPNGE